MPDEIKYKYSYRKEGDSNYTNYKETTENTCKFEKLLSNKKYYLFLQKTIDILAQHGYTKVVPKRERKERFENHT